METRQKNEKGMAERLTAYRNTLTTEKKEKKPEGTIHTDEEDK